METLDRRREEPAVPKQIKPEMLPERVTNPRLSCFGQLERRRDSLTKTVVLARTEGSRRGRPNTRGPDSVKEAGG